jgi:phosphocarrier protein NPr
VIQTQITIINKLGLHARAAAKFVDCTKAFSSNVQAGVEGQLVDAKSIMSVMMLAAGKGTVLNLEIEGSDEEEALNALRSLIEDRFGEPE